MTESVRRILIFIAVLMLIPAFVFSLLLGVPGLFVVLTREIDSFELWITSVSWLVMLAASVASLIALMRSSRGPAAMWMLILAISWIGVAWDRHREEFIGWMLAGALLALAAAAAVVVVPRNQID